MKFEWNNVAKFLVVSVLFSCLFLRNSAEAFGGFSFRAGRGVLWTWVGGPASGTAGTYGTKGTPSTSNIPGKRAYGCAALAPNGYVYLFGGDAGTKYYNDVWRYNPANGEWTWLAGASGSINGGTGGNWGTQGVAAGTNTPNSRKELGCWADSNSNFWIFGGLSTTSNNFNDLWKFDITTNQWTWVSGSSTANPAAVYGTKGVEASGNMPSGRERFAYWADSSDQLWFFGGYDNAAAGRKNDLWRYKISTGYWTWMSGTNVISDAGTYGTLGVPSTSNIPSHRTPNPGCVDPSGNFWFFGGNQASGLRFNDLWKYNPSTNEWTWMAGPSSGGQAGVYGTRLVPNAANVPKGRSLSALHCGNTGDIYIVFGYDGTGELNDVDSFNPISMMWTWLSGTSAINPAGVNGTINVPAWTNVPSGRDGHITWSDNNGNIWMFGGTDSGGTYNDLWKGTVY